MELDLERARAFLQLLGRVLGYTSEDLEDAMRIVESFDEHYRYSVKKFKEFLTPAKRESELIAGRSVIDRIRLVKKGEEKRVVFVFDRRVNRDSVRKALEQVLKASQEQE